MLSPDERTLYVGDFAAKRVIAIPLGSIALPAGAGTGTSNLAFHQGWLYITESFNNDVWRVRVKVPPHPLVHKR